MSDGKGGRSKEGREGTEERGGEANPLQKSGYGTA